MKRKKHLTVTYLLAFLVIYFLPIAKVFPLTNSGLVSQNGEITEQTAVCTMITGDVFQVTRMEDGRYIISTTSNEKAFQTTILNDDTYVIPAHAERFVSSTLDKQLFNIDYLVENGYCDAEVTALPVIIEYTKNPGKKHAKINTAPGLRKKLDFKTVEAISADVAKEEADDFARATFRTGGGLKGVKKIWLDRKIKLSLNESVPGIGAPYVWGEGYDGGGIKIAILDTGIWKDHPDLTDKVIAEMDFSDDGTPTDLFGHGTHCAGIAAANGTVKGVAPGALLINAKVLNQYGSGLSSWAMAAWEWAAEQGARVFSMSFGAGPTDGTSPEDMVLNGIVDMYDIVAVASSGNFGTYYGVSTPAAADKVIAVGATTKRGIPRLSVVSPEVKEIKPGIFDSSPIPPVEGIEEPIVYTGFGCGPEDFEGIDIQGKIALIRSWDCSINEKVENAANAGAVAAIIFNNFQGSFFEILDEPACIPAVSISLEDGTYLLDLLESGEVMINLYHDPEGSNIADFSSRGPRLDNAVKPEIVAPGVAIYSTVPTGSCTLCNPSGYLSLSGTSMSAPHIAGAAALLLQKYPEWDHMEIRDGLMSTAETIPEYDIYTQGSGLVAVDSAIDAGIVFEPAGINMGTIPLEIWSDNPIQNKSFTIRNHGSEGITLDLSIEKIHDINGGTFDIATLDKSTVTISGGGVETATLTIDLTASPENTPLGGRIIAKDAETGKEIHAIFGIYKDLKYEFRIKMIDPEGLPWAGNPIILADAVNLNPVGGGEFLITDSEGEITVKLPQGVYNVFSAIPWDKGIEWPSFPIYWLHSLEFQVFEDTSLTLDARDAKPITLDMSVDETIPYVTNAAIVYNMKDVFLGPYPATQGNSWTVGLHRIDNYVLPATATIGQINGYVRFQEIRGSEWSDYFPVKSTGVYDLFYTMLKEITAPVTYKVNNGTLQQMALVKSRHFSTDINPREHRWGMFAFPTEFFIPTASISPMSYMVPIEREEYMTPDKAYYMQMIMPSNDYAYYPWIRFSDCPMGLPEILWNVYETGEQIEKTWLEQPVKPWAVKATRSHNKIRVGGYNQSNGMYDAYEAMDSGGNMVYFAPYGLTFETKVYKDEELIWTNPDSYYWEQSVAAEEADYKIELYSKNVPSTCLNCMGVFEPYWTSFSTETFTTVKFTSTYCEGKETLPIINLNYKVPGLRINNVKFIPEKNPFSIHIIPQSLKGLDINMVQFWYSYDDGAVWTEVDNVVKGTDEWMAKAEYQENYISVRVLAIDEEGNSSEQTIMRAFYVTSEPQEFWFDV